MKHLINSVDKYRKLIFETERYVWENPETGFKEYKTSAYMEKVFTDLGYDIVKAEDCTGFYTVIDTKIPGPVILVLGELDSVICPAHKEADPETGAVHSCGHNAQLAALVGIAAALKEPNALEGLCGKIKLCAVPAEELLEIEFRSRLIEQGKIKYYGGKTEFLHRGYFDDVDIALMVHTASGDLPSIIKGSVGCIAKRIIYKGVAAHAGGCPWNGVNALYAANCGINAANSIRETFPEADIIRFHPIITSGGAMVNAIPETVTAESYVRGSSFDGILRANKRLNRALIGGALSLGANIEIIDRPGYAPHYNSPALMELFKEAYKIGFDQEIEIKDVLSSGSTDMGDLSSVMPVIHPYSAGASGTAHGADYQIADPEKACVDSAKWQLSALYLLLSDNGARAKDVIANFKPPFASKKEYLDFIDSICDDGYRIEYDGDSAKVKL